MNIPKTILWACGLMFACMAATVQAVESKIASGAAAASSTPASKPAPAANETPANAKVGEPFSIRLKEDKNCGMVKSLDQVSLLVNGMETGLHPLGCDPATNELAFAIRKDDVTATPVTNAAWQAILGRPWNSAKSDFKRDLRYTVMQPADSADAQIMSSGKLKLLIACPGFGLAGTAMVAALWIALAYLGRNSGMLRDDGNQGTTLQHRTYSLGRVQMAWWFGIIMGAYIFLWAITLEIPTLGSQALLLMGISGVTGLTSAGLDASRQTILPVSSGKFFDDLLTDAYGVALHRFQMLAITVILGVMFIIHVATTLTMPEFDGSLLALMGIAGGTYVGFKFPEKQVDQPGKSGVVAPAATPEEHKAGYTPEPESPAGK